MPSIEEIAAEEEIRYREISRERRRRLLIFFGIVFSALGWFYFAKGWMGKGGLLILLSLAFLLSALEFKKYFQKFSPYFLLFSLPVALLLFILYGTTHISSFYWGKDPSFWLSVHAGAVGEPFWSPLPTLLGQAACYLFPTRQFTLLPLLSGLVLSTVSVFVLISYFLQLKTRNSINMALASIICLTMGFSHPWWDSGTIGSGLIASLGLFLFLIQRELLRCEEKPWKCLCLVLGLLFSVHPFWGILGFVNHFAHMDYLGRDLKAGLSPFLLGLTPYLWLYFRAGCFFPSWGGTHPFFIFLKEWRGLWEWHLSADWDPKRALEAFGIPLGIMCLMLLFLAGFNLFYWKTGNPRMIRIPDVWVCILAALFGWASYSSSSGQLGPTALWVPAGLGSLLLSFIEKGMDRKLSGYFSGLPLALGVAVILLLTIGLAFLPGQDCLRNLLNFPEQHALNLLRVLNGKSLLIFDDPFEAAACREIRLIEPFQPKAVFLEERYLNRRWYMAQCIDREPDLVFSSIQGSPEGALNDLVVNNYPDWEIHWACSRMPSDWKGLKTFPTVLTQEFTGPDLSSHPPENVQFRYDLTSLPEPDNREWDPSTRYILRYSQGFDELGMALMGLGQYSAAIRSFERAAHLDPMDEEPRKALSQIFTQQNLLEAARLDFEKTIKQHPARIEDLMHQIEQVKKNQDEVRTVLLLDEMIRLNQELSDAQYHLAMIYEKQGNLTESKALLESSVKLNPQRLEAQLTLGHLMAKLGNRIRAEEAFRSVLGIDPQNKDAQKELWRLLNQP